MLIDRPQVVEGSYISNATVDSGPTNPTSTPSAPLDNGQLFFNTTTNKLLAYSTTLTTWAEPGSAILTTHIGDAALHLTPAQNTLLDVQLNGLLATAAELNHSVGVLSPIQTQLNTVAGNNTALDGRVTTLETTTVPAVQNNLTTHIGDTVLHVTAGQSTLLDALTATATELNYSVGLTSSIVSQFLAVNTNKVSRSGDSMSGNLAMGTNRVTGLGAPGAATDAATKQYVDDLVNGMHWFEQARLATTADIALTGAQSIDGFAVVTNDRILVKDQTDQTENGIYLANTLGAWPRAADYFTLEDAHTSALFVTAGTTQNKSSWVQINSLLPPTFPDTPNTPLGTQALFFAALSGPIVNVAGPGINLLPNGEVNVRAGNGITFDGGNAVTLNVATSDFSTAAPQLVLAPSGVVAGAYNTSTTQHVPFSVDAKGRVTTIGVPLTIAPAFSSITATPTTLAGYGITNAPTVTGTGASGTWGISITGNAVTATSATSATTATTAASANALSGITSSISSAVQSGTISSLIGQDTNNSLYRYNITALGAFGLLTTSNYNSYAPTLTGTGASGTWFINVTGSAGSVQGYGPSVGASASSLVLRDTNGYIFNTYFNSSDNSQASGVSAVMVKAGDNYIRSGTAQAVATFLSGSTMNISGSATSAPAGSLTGGTLASGVTSASLNSITATFGQGISFGTNNVPGYMVLNTAGALQVNGGITTTTGTFTPSTTGVSTGLNCVNGDITTYRAGGTTGVIYLSSSGSNYLYWDATNYNLNGGGLIVSGDIAAFSDRRVKTDIEPIHNALDKVMQLEGVSYKRTDNGEFGIGVIAQDLQKVIPEVVKENEDGMLSVAYGNLVGLLIEAIKELRAEVTALKEQQQ